MPVPPLFWNAILKPVLLLLVIAYLSPDAISCTDKVIAIELSKLNAFEYVIDLVPVPETTSFSETVNASSCKVTPTAVTIGVAVLM